MAVSLSYQTVDLGMSAFAEDYHLTAGTAEFPILGRYLLLKRKHYRTGAVDEIDSGCLGQPISGRRLAMCADKYCRAFQGREILISDSPEPLLLQTADLRVVVDYRPERIQTPVPAQIVLYSRYGPAHSIAAPRMPVYNHLHRLRSFNRFRNHSSWSSTVMSLLSSSTASPAIRRGAVSRWVSI